MLVRHGEIIAVTDDPGSIPVTAVGHVQAASPAAFLSTSFRQLARRPELIVVSPFPRTRQTAAALLAGLPAVPVKEWPVQEFVHLAPAICVGTNAAQRRPRVEEYWHRLDRHFIDGEGAESFGQMV